MRPLADGSGYSICRASEDRVGKGRCNHTLENIEKPYTESIHNDIDNYDFTTSDAEKYSKKNFVTRTRNKIVNSVKPKLKQFCIKTYSYIESELVDYLSERKLKTDILEISEYMPKKKYKKTVPIGNSVGACNDRTCYILEDGPHPEQTNIHEYVHYLSDNSTYSTDKLNKYDDVCGISINENSKYFNEALTKMFTQDILKEDYDDTSPYKKEKDKVLDLTNILGKEIIKEVYFQNKPRKLEAIIDYYSYKGAFKELSKLFDKLHNSSENTEPEIIKNINNILDILRVKSRRS